MTILRYIYGESHLPKQGWIQGCRDCDVYTSRTIEYCIFIKKNMYTFEIYLCPPCQRIYKSDTKDDFNNKCDKFVEEHLEACRAQSPRTALSIV
jgi:hypothetical protein